VECWNDGIMLKSEITFFKPIFNVPLFHYSDF